MTEERTRLNSEGAGGTSTGGGNLDLQLPSLAFRNIKDARLLALDIGGSLAKIAYYSPVPLKRLRSNSTNDPKEVFEEYEGARLHFIKVSKCCNHLGLKAYLYKVYVTISLTV